MTDIRDDYLNVIMDVQTHASDLCCICLDDLHSSGLGRQRLPCGHTMHELCVTELRRRGASGRCPLCRATHADLTPVQVLLDRAALHRGRKEFEAGASLWAQVLDIEPSNSCAAGNLGYCYQGGFGVLHDVDRAMSLYEEASRGGDMIATCNLGVLYFEQSNFQKAMELYEEAHRGGNARAAVNLGRLHHKRGDLQKAMELFEEAHRGGDKSAACNLGTLYLQQGDLRKAIEFYEVARRGGIAEAASILDDIENACSYMYTLGGNSSMAGM